MGLKNFLFGEAPSLTAVTTFRFFYLRGGSREDHLFAAALVTSIRFEDLDIRDLCFSSKAENILFTSLDRHFSFDTTILVSYHRHLPDTQKTCSQLYEPS